MQMQTQMQIQTQIQITNIHTGETFVAIFFFLLKIFDFNWRYSRSYDADAVNQLLCVASVQI